MNHPASDGPAIAGQSLRRLIAARESAPPRGINLATPLVGLSAAAAASAAILLTEDVVDAVLAELTITGVALACVATLRRPRAAAVTASTLTTAAAVMAAGHNTTPPIATVAAIGLVLACPALLDDTRRQTRPALPLILMLHTMIAISAAFGTITEQTALPWLTLFAAAVSVATMWRGEWQVTLRARRARWRSGITYYLGATNSSPTRAAMTLENLKRGERAERRTGQLLSRLGPQWAVLHSRALPHTSSDADHIAIGPAGIVLIDTKSRSGEFRYRTSGDGEPSWTYNGNSMPYSLVQSSMFEALTIRRAFGIDNDRAPTVTVVLAIHAAMNVRWAPAHFDVTDADTGEQRAGTASVVLVNADYLADYLHTLPAQPPPRPTWRERRRGNAAGLDHHQVAAARYLTDLTAVCDHLFVPKQ